MAESNFVDYVKIYCRSGKGGRGSMHLRHVKYNPNGGPDGGDGGDGGSVILRGNHNYWTLLHLKFQRHVFAEHGGNGGRDKCHGKDGKDQYIDVPCGTVVYNAETGKYVCDVTYDGQEVVLLKGGRGGLGNFQFRSATNQAPRFAQPGEPMEEMTVIMELKLLADVGLVGFPNAGKSTLLSALSSARPKIANYPFTTLEPSLGIVDYRDHKSFVMADIPGIIEGASEGAGLGHDFLRHIDRCRLLVHVVDVSGSEGRDPVEDFETITQELAQYSPELARRPVIVAANKLDLLPPDSDNLERLKAAVAARGYELFEISAATTQGTRELVRHIAGELNSLPPIITFEPDYVKPLAEAGDADDLQIERFDDVWSISGAWLQQLVIDINFDDAESRMYFDRQLRKSGLFDKLEQLGIRDGDTVSLYDLEFIYER